VYNGAANADICSTKQPLLPRRQQQNVSSAGMQ